MSEIRSKGLEGREAPGQITLTPELQGHVDSPRGPITILNCKDAEGQDSGLDMYGISLSDLFRSLNINDTSPDGKGIISGLRSGKFASLLKNLSLVGSLALGAAACNTEDKGDRGSYSAQYGTQASALTSYAQVLNVDTPKAQAVPWSLKSDASSNFAEIDGVRYLMVANWQQGNVRYVACDKLTKLFDCIVSGTPKDVQGLNTGSEPFVENSPAMWKDLNGNQKFSVGGTGDFSGPNTYIGDVKENATGNLEASNMTAVASGFGYPNSFFMVDGVPSLLGPQGLMNLDTGVVENVNVNATTSYASTFDGEAAVGSRKQTLMNGTSEYKLVAAKGANAIQAVEALSTNPTFLTTLNNLGVRLINPRIISDGANGSVLVFSMGDAGKEILWIVPIPADKPPVDADATGDTTVDSDAGSTADQDAAVTPDQDAAADQDATTPLDAAKDSTADEVDTILLGDADIEEVTPDVLAQDVPPELPTPDVGPDTDTNGSTDAADAQITPDTSKPDTAPDTTEVTPTLTGFEVTVGDCKLEPTPITQGGKDGFNVDIHGSGANNALCKFKGLSNGKPVEITLSNDASGDIQITCITFAGSELNCEVGLDTTAELLEDKAGAKIKANGITLGSAASHFFTTRRPNGFVDIKNAKGEPLVTVDGPNFTFTVPGDDKVYRIDTKTGDMEEKFPDFPNADAGTSIDVQPQHFDASGSDASVSTPPPGKGGGCEAGPGSVNSSAAMLAAAAGAAILFFRRKREAERK